MTEDEHSLLYAAMDGETDEVCRLLEEGVSPNVQYSV